MKMNEKRQPGIILKGVFLKSLNFRLGEKDPKSLTYSLGLGADFSYSLSPDKKKMKASLAIDCMKGVENPPFDLSLSVDGYFETTKKVNLSVEDYAKEMAAALLMPFVRELVANVTSRIPYPPILLPPINIYALLAAQKRLLTRKKH